jgi:hypothetical protein
MTDEDSVRRFHRAVGVGNVYTRRQYENSKLQWVWNANGSEVERVIEMLWPGLGARRQGRAEEVLIAAAASPKRILKTHCIHGHKYTDDNTIWRKGRPGERRCRQCARRSAREYGRRQRITGKGE